MGMLISNEPDFMIHGGTEVSVIWSGLLDHNNDHRHVDHHSTDPDPCGTGEPDPQKGNGPAGEHFRMCWRWRTRHCRA